MNRIGLSAALACATVFGLLFGLFPELDLKIAALFYSSRPPHFPAQDQAWLSVLRHGAMVLVWVPSIAAGIALIRKIALPQSRLLLPGRMAALFLLTLILVPGILSNAVFKNHWGRPRPVDVTQFQGGLAFVPWWDPRGACPENCSFFSGEASTAFWAYAPAAVAPPAWQPLAFVAATVFGLAVGLLRMSFGGHFMSDVLAGGVVAFLMVWLLHGLLYRWPRTARSEGEFENMFARTGLAIRHLFRRQGGGADSRTGGRSEEGSPRA